MAVSIYPYLCLEFVHEQTQVRFNERYFNDPEYRHQQDIIINQKLFDYFGRYWPEYAPNYAAEPGYIVGVGQAFVIMAALFGSQIAYYDNFHPDCTPNPRAWVTDADQLRVPDVSNTWPMSQYLDQYAGLVAKYGLNRVSIPGFDSQAVHSPRLRGLTMHSPLTTAYKLRGDRLFLDMVDQPQLVQRLFAVIRDTYCQICDLLIETAGHKTDVIFFGACFSSLVSEPVWRQWEMPAIIEIAARYNARILLHSCGRSTHILKPLSELPYLLEAHLGDVTDLAEARRLMPDIGFYIVPDSVGWARNPPEETCKSVKAMMAAAASGSLAFQFVMEGGLPSETVRAVVETVRNYNASNGDGKAEEAG
jgi:hypothetical protein